MKAYLVLEDNMLFKGEWLGGQAKAGEVVFNTSHSGYEEMATDPSYFSQILVTTATQQGNYGVNRDFWESSKYHISGFVCLEMQNSKRDSSWLNALTEKNIPVISEVDTRELVLYLREKGTLWGACVQADSEDQAHSLAKPLIQSAKKISKDWAQLVCSKDIQDYEGQLQKGPKVAIIDYGCKKNILREVLQRSSQVRTFPSLATAKQVLEYNADAIVLSNGPGDPNDVEKAPEMIQELLGKKPIFGICMGHQLLAKALGAKVYRLKYGHRGSNHPIKDHLSGRVYMTSQNHGYAVDAKDLPKSIKITHTNLNDNTVAGIESLNFHALSVQFHPESHPGPNDAVDLFDRFLGGLKAR